MLPSTFLIIFRGKGKMMPYTIRQISQFYGGGEISFCAGDTVRDRRTANVQPMRIVFTCIERPERCPGRDIGLVVHAEQTRHVPNRRQPAVELGGMIERSKPLRVLEAQLRAIETDRSGVGHGENTALPVKKEFRILHLAGQLRPAASIKFPGHAIPNHTPWRRHRLQTVIKRSIEHNIIRPIVNK